MNRTAVVRCDFGPNGGERWFDRDNHTHPLPMKVAEIWWMRIPTVNWSVTFHPWVDGNASMELTGASNYRLKVLFTDGSDQILEEYWNTECPRVWHSGYSIFTNSDGSFNDFGYQSNSCPIYDESKQAKVVGLKAEFEVGCGAVGQFSTASWMFMLNPIDPRLLV
jgi:hypothetical protein